MGRFHNNDAVTAIVIIHRSSSRFLPQIEERNI